MSFSKSTRRPARARQATARPSIDYVVEALERRVQLSVSLTLSGTQTLTPGSVVNASNDSSAWQTEMSVAVNPTNPLNIAGFMHHVVRSTGDRNTIDVVYSTNGGATWNTNAIDGSDDGLGTGIVRGDPTITFDDEGRLFICYGFVSTAGFTLKLAVDAVDGGASFEQFTTVDSGVPIDKWIMTSGIDPVTDEQAIYIAYMRRQGSNDRVVVTGSNNGGSTFTTPVTVDDAPSSAGLFACPAVTADGELYVSWWGGSVIYVDRDLNGLFDVSPNNDFGADVTVRTLANGGMFKYPIPAQPDRGMHTGPVLAVDRSGGTHDGRLYVAFVEKTSTALSEDDTNIMLAYSDNGSSWTPVSVDSRLDSSEFLPWVDVDQATGSVNVLYYTTRGDESTGNEDVKMRLATSLNGGSSWTFADATSSTSDEYEDNNEIEDSEWDYLEYIGLDVHQGTAHGLFGFEPFGPGADQFDLESLYVNTAFVSSSNTLTVNGDDGGVNTNDTILVRRNSLNNNYLEVVVNGATQFAGRYATVGKIVVNGLNGNDTVTVSPAVTIAVTVNGGAGHDTITGGGGSDSLLGFAGNDSIIGGAGSDVLDGGDDDDTLGSSDGIFDQLFGGAGYDWAGIDAIDSRTGVEVVHISGGGGGQSPAP